ncbi:hypothetical protein KI387_031448, partial [Taxus chinensis]
MAVVDFFEPATTFIQRWLPLFYVPSLVVLPLAVKGIPASSAAKIGAIIDYSQKIWGHESTPHHSHTRAKMVAGARQMIRIYFLL